MHVICIDIIKEEPMPFQFNPSLVEGCNIPPRLLSKQLDAQNLCLDELQGPITINGYSNSNPLISKVLQDGLNSMFDRNTDKKQWFGTTRAGTVMVRQQIDYLRGGREFLEMEMRWIQYEAINRVWDCVEEHNGRPTTREALMNIVHEYFQRLNGPTKLPIRPQTRHDYSTSCTYTLRVHSQEQDIDDLVYVKCTSDIPVIPSKIPSKYTDAGITKDAVIRLQLYKTSIHRSKNVEEESEEKNWKTLDGSVFATNINTKSCMCKDCKKPFA